MSSRSLIEPSPWDRAALGVDSFELKAATPEAMAQMRKAPGHYSIRVDLLAPTKLLQDQGFYYCDTLIEPYCDRPNFVAHRSVDASVTREVALEAVLAMCHGASAHGRFHRDFNVEKAQADDRYDRWLAELHGKGQVYELQYCGALAGFAAVVESKLVLHALAKSHRGRGLARGLWTVLCETLFAAGARQVSRSISAANLAALNLYAALGFRFRNPTDLYHCVIP